MRATLDQAKQILNLVSQSKASREQVQKVIGLLPDLLKTNFNQIDQEELRKVLGLPEQVGYCNECNFI